MSNFGLSITENIRDYNVEDYAEIAHTLVDSAIERAMNLIQCAECQWGDIPKAFRYEGGPSRENEPRMSDVRTSEEDLITSINGLTIEEFTPETGEKMILEFINSWDKDDCWLYYITLIDTDNLEFDVRYRYKVCFSIPTRCQPIPRATASVYFTVDVSKIKPSDTLVDVFYVFETNRLVHRPGKSLFQENWLKEILLSKMAIRELIDF